MTFSFKKLDPLMRLLWVIQWVFTFAVLLLLALSFKGWLRVNTSDSLPGTLFWSQGAQPQYKVGQVVSFCPPNQPSVQRFLAAMPEKTVPLCDNGQPRLAKRVVAVAPSVVEVTEVGVFVDKVLLPNSAPLAIVREGVPLGSDVLGRHQLKGTEVWAMSDAKERGFDGRYFGPVSPSNAQQQVELQHRIF